LIQNKSISQALKKLEAFSIKETQVDQRIELFQNLKTLTDKKKDVYLLFHKHKENDEDKDNIVQETSKLQGV
jgi:hypothetical protein